MGNPDTTFQQGSGPVPLGPPAETIPDAHGIRAVSICQATRCGITGSSEAHDQVGPLGNHLP